jgi:hypothetical protein
VTKDLSDGVVGHPYRLVKVVTSTKCTSCNNYLTGSHVFFVNIRNSEPSIFIIEATVHCQLFFICNIQSQYHRSGMY